MQGQACLIHFNFNQQIVISSLNQRSQRNSNNSIEIRHCLLSAFKIRKNNRLWVAISVDTKCLFEIVIFYSAFNFMTGYFLSHTKDLTWWTSSCRINVAGIPARIANSVSGLKPLTSRAYKSTFSLLFVIKISVIFGSTACACIGNSIKPKITNKEIKIIP